MKGEARFLNRFLDGADKRFIIPVYQRNYDWGLEQCKQLYDDLVKLVRHKRKSHFFGSIVSVHDPYAGSQEFLIIDGQQRLTTVSLMLLALHKLLQEGLLTAEESSLKKKIFETYLVDAYQPEETRIKLKPIKRDQEAFNRLFHAESEYLYYAQAEEENNAVPLRREFWSYALPEIRERTGAFDGVRSLDYNWINTPSAYAGLNYGCIVNLKNARVELYISVGNKEDTKRIFDRLYVHRAEIEAAYGGELRWASAPEKISCKVSVTRRGIELVNREDWPQISAFFADSCARLMRATEPYLERIMD